MKKRHPHWGTTPDQSLSEERIRETAKVESPARVAGRRRVEVMRLGELPGDVIAQIETAEYGATPQ